MKAGAQASKGFGSGSTIYVFDEGGMLLDLAIGAQKFSFKPAALGRFRKAVMHSRLNARTRNRNRKKKRHTAKKKRPGEHH